jgi:hypothetical protein
LLNRGELEARIDPWLTAAGLTRAACGRRVFTWTVFRIECDPQSAIKLLEAFDLRLPDLRDGAPYRAPEARRPGRVRRKAAGPDAASFEVVLAIDPDAVRRARAEADVAVSEIVGPPVTLDAALRRRAKESISGTIRVTFDVDAAGNLRRRTTVTRRTIKGPDGRSESETLTETVERQLTTGQGRLGDRLDVAAHPL